MTGNQRKQKKKMQQEKEKKKELQEEAAEESKDEEAATKSKDEEAAAKSKDEDAEEQEAERKKAMLQDALGRFSVPGFLVLTEIEINGRRRSVNPYSDTPIIVPRRWWHGD